MRWLLSYVALGALSLAYASTVAAQQPTCTPPNQLGIVYVIDDSSSMDTSDPDILRGTAVEIGLRGAPNGSVASVVAFASGSRVITPPTVLDGASVVAIRDQVRQALTGSGSTNYDAAFLAAKRQLDAMPSTVDRKAVVFISDGEPTSSYDENVPIASAGVPIFTIGFDSAPPAELSTISASSPGGTAASVTSAGDTQAAVGKILGGLTCQSVLGGQVVDVRPGEVTRVPFDVRPEDANLEVLATWARATVTVELERPDLSRLAPGRERGGETLEAGTTFARATSEIPDAGRWYVLLTSNSDVPVKVSVDFLGKKFGTPAYGPPPLDPGCTGPGATNQTTIASRQVWSPCLLPSGNGFISRGPTRINGIDLRPEGELRISNLGTIAGSGTVGFVVSPRIPGLNGFLVLPGVRPDQVNLARSVRLPATIENLFGLPFVKSAGAEVAWDRDGLLLKAALEFKDSGVVGDLTRGVNPKGKLIPGYGLTTEFRASNATGLVADRIEATASEIRAFRSVSIKEVKLTVRPVARTIGGKGTFAFGSAGKLAPEVSAALEWSLERNAFSSLKVEADLINKPVFHPAIFLRKVGLEIADGRSLTPAVTTPKFAGGMAFSLGPTVEAPVLGKFNVFEVDGEASILYPDKITITSGVKLLSLITLAEGGLSLDIPALQGSVWGRVNFTLPVGLGYEGAVQGGISLSPFGFDATGRGRVSLPLGSYGGQAVLTQNGVGACAQATVNLGFTKVTRSVGGAVKVSDLAGSATALAQSLLNGCDFAKVTRALKAQTAGAVRVATPRGHLVLVHLPGAADQQLIIARRGQPDLTVTIPATGSFTGPGTIAGRDSVGGAWLLIGSQKGGTTSIRTTSGASLAGVQIARSLKPLRGSGRVVSGRNGERALRYRLTGLRPGDRIRIVETSQTAGRQVLRTTRRARGTVRFRPAFGFGQRTIVAVVEQAGRLRGTVTLARYRATRRPAPPRRVRVTGKAPILVATWRPPSGGGASRYQVDLVLADARRLTATTARTRFRLRDVPRGTRGAVLVRALFRDGRVSTPVRVPLRVR